MTLRNNEEIQSARDAKSPSRRQLLKSAMAAVTVTAAANKKAKAASRDSSGPKGKLAQLVDRTRTAVTPLKQQAANDYCQSLQAYGGQLSSPIRDLFATAERSEEIHFGVVVIGSGYGASIAAARLSNKLRPEHRICILERGKEWSPGTFPDTFSHVRRNLRSKITGPSKGQMVQPLGLYDVQMNDEVNILAGSGLGGGSLINASIALRPHREVFQQSAWPIALNDMETLNPYYDQVARMMSLSRTPFDLTPKVRVRRQAAERMSSSPSFFDLSHIGVMYDHRYLDDQMRNPQGMIQRPCTLCGDCATGCNVGSKNTLAMNYLPVARRNGTEMYTQVTVDSIEKCVGHYRVHLTYIDDQHDRITRHPVSINTQMVVVGAGSPGSAAILLESQTESFEFSPQLGCGWSGNGDTIGFIKGLPAGTNIGGYGAYPSKRGPVGPIVQCSLNYYRDIELRRRLLIQDASVPRGVGNVFSLLLRDAELDHSMIMLGMGHDDAAGRVVKKSGRWQVKWEGLKESEYRKMVVDEFKRLAAAHGGEYLKPQSAGNNLATVHPLGGCRMSDDPNVGPVNHLGQVYDFHSGGYLDSHGQPAVHPGLYVADASIMPTALGVNPYMTIGALSERISRHIVNNPAHAHLFEN